MSTLLEEMKNSLEVRELGSILPHEQVVQANVLRLKQIMLNIGTIVDPLLVDKKTGVLLDGHHRLKVLEHIECPRAVCQTVDYTSKDIHLGTWYPTISLNPEQIYKLDSLKHEKVDFEAGMETINKFKAPFMVATKTKGYHLINPGTYSLNEMIAEQTRIVSLLEKGTVEYIAEVEAQRYLDENKSVLYRRPYTKEEVVKMAEMHTPLPPKSTRHLIPGRILRLNMKLGWLHKPKEETTKELHDMLTTRVLGGNVRRYYESVIVIY